MLLSTLKIAKLVTVVDRMHRCSRMSFADPYMMNVLQCEGKKRALYVQKVSITFFNCMQVKY